MLEKIKIAFFPRLIGLALMCIGWYISILNVGLTRFQTDVLFSKWTLFGLTLIIIGAYLPGIWIGISEWVSKK
jgi:hypothetical protein